MENLVNVSSEEELLQLRNEGKISEDEYEELRSAMRKSTKLDVEPPTAETNKAKSKRKLGKIAFYLMLVGFALGPVCFGVWAMIAPESGQIGPWLLLGLPLEVVAFGLGVAAWPDTFAKVTVVAIAFIVVLAWLFNADLQW